MEIVYCVISLIVGAICAFIAGGISSSKGRSYSGGFFVGLFLGIIGVIIVSILPKDEEALEEKMLMDGTKKECPYCAEIIWIDAKVCRYCRRELVKPKRSVAKINPPIELSQLENSPQIQYCPQCGIPVKIAKAISGDFQGQDFYVCPNYQQCNQYWRVAEI